MVGHEDFVIVEHNEKFKEIDHKFSVIADNRVKDQQELTRLGESTKSAHKRLNEQAEQVKAVYELATAISYMTEKIEETISWLKKHDDRMISIELGMKEKADKKEIETLDKKIEAAENKPGKMILGWLEKAAGTVVLLLILYVIFMLTDGKIGG